MASSEPGHRGCGAPGATDRAGGGFTLIELLVVIAIIALLDGHVEFHNAVTVLRLIW